MGDNSIDSTAAAAASSATQPVTGTEQTAAPPTPSGTSSGGSGTFSTSTTVGSLEELQKKMPEVYNAMLQGIAQKICSDMKSHQENIHKLNAEARRDG